MGGRWEAGGRPVAYGEVVGTFVILVNIHLFNSNMLSISNLGIYMELYKYYSIVT